MPTPTNFEQEAFELLNRTRLDPQGEFAHLIVDAASQTGVIPSITSALRAFGTDVSAFEAQLAGYAQVAPLAWDTRLATSADAHSQRMIDLDEQFHVLPGELTIPQKFQNVAYTYRYAAENVFAFTQSPLQGHAGFIIDWGYDDEDITENGQLLDAWRTLGDGIQDPAGHRDTILSPLYVDVGLSALAENNPGTEVGPFVVTQHFGAQSVNASRVLGVVFSDSNADGFYTAGEGIGGVTWQAGGSSVAGWASGGYQLTPSVNAGSVLVTASVPTLAGAAVATLDLQNENAKLDLVETAQGWGYRTSVSLTMGVPVSGTPISRAELLGNADIHLTSVDGIDAHLTGNGGANVLTGALGDDTALGGLGDDTLSLGGGDDSARGDAGNDLIHGGAGADTLRGGDGNDTIWGEDGADLAFLGFGNDLFVDNAQGGPDGSDTVWAWAGDDTIQGGNGDDHFFGEGGQDVIHGRRGDDKLHGGTGYDTIYAGEGNDTVWGGNGRDKVYLAAGDDVYFDNGQGGVHGRDSVYAGGGNDTINGGNGDDRFYGGSGDDVIWGRRGNDMAFGGTGNDTIYSGDENDTVYGGDGSDLSFLGSGNDVWYDSDDATGDDFIFGAGGDDQINLRRGNDTAEGSTGADSFRLVTTLIGHDQINDFEIGVDSIEIYAPLWSGSFDAATFESLADTSSGDLVLTLEGGSLTLVGIGSTDGVFADLSLIA